ncbi:hemerythrin domain-containing protein [Shewanella sp. SR44-3]|uniref:hemerythrin domain-containing protein n=1 Tax=unclassified Shewanella TaxID=196818 RepID=UPI0015F7BC89|nr:hemerythrin domain-containing protein [Shewanella sp. SR44-3]MBB1269223.1 hemerythrin [Shewanella sp. SR44-3]
MLKRLLQDHKHISILLDILVQKRLRLLAGSGVDFKVIRDIVEYMQVYAEHSHHPVEDIIFSHFVAKSVSLDNKLFDDMQLEDEHHKLIAASQNLMFSINLVLSDVVLSKDKLVADLSDYLTLQQQHMEYEEGRLFPLFEQHLSAVDWQEINQACQQKLIDDPLFSQTDDVLFESLREYFSNTDTSR